MRVFRQSNVLRLGTVVAVLLSWVLLTNHCALAAGFGKFARSAASEEQDELPPCHRPPAPEKQGHQQDAPCEQMLGCCKGVKASMPDNALPVFAPLALPIPDFLVLPALLPPAPESIPEVIEEDTGPPGEASFAELVLQRSLHAHAPPLAA